MTEAFDALEAELSALLPQEVSPGLRRRVAERLGAAAPAKTRPRWVIALAGGLAAACLAAIFLWWCVGRHGEPEQTIIRPRPTPTVEFEDTEPTLLAYRLALARSPDELDALLDRQAVSAAEPEPRPLEINVFIPSAAAMHALQGDD